MKNFVIYVTVLVLIIIISCSRNNITDPTENNFIYPIKIGNKWEYVREYSIFNFRPDTLYKTQIIDTTLIDTVQIEIIRKQIILDSIQTFVFYESFIENGQVIEAESYYNNLDDGLYEYAYKGISWVLPKTNIKGKILFKGKYFNNIKEVMSYFERSLLKSINVFEDSLILEIPPLLSIKYPLEVGSQWIYRGPGNPWAINKNVIDREIIKVAAGEFNCFKIQWLFDIDNNDEWDDDIIFYDYVSTKGLIKRYAFIKDMIWIGEDGLEIGMFDSKDEYILSKINL